MAEASSAASAQEHIQNNLPPIPQASSTQMRYESQRSDQFVKPSNIFGCALPPPANGLPSQLGCEQSLPILLSFPSYRTTGHVSVISPRMSDIPDLPSFGGAPAPIAHGTMQLDRLFHQMQTTRQQDEAHNRDMIMQFDPSNGVALPLPFVSCDPFNLNGGLQMSQTQSICNPVSIYSRDPETM